MNDVVFWACAAWHDWTGNEPHTMFNVFWGMVLTCLWAAVLEWQIAMDGAPLRTCGKTALCDYFSQMHPWSTILLVYLASPRVARWFPPRKPDTDSYSFCGTKYWAIYTCIVRYYYRFYTRQRTKYSLVKYRTPGNPSKPLNSEPVLSNLFDTVPSKKLFLKQRVAQVNSKATTKIYWTFLTISIFILYKYIYCGIILVNDLICMPCMAHCQTHLLSHVTNK